MRLFLSISLILFISGASFAQLSIAYNPEKKDLAETLMQLENLGKSDVVLLSHPSNATVKIFTQDDISYWTAAGISLQHFTNINRAGYALQWSAERKILFILAIDQDGVKNAVIKLKTELLNNDLSAIENGTFNYIR